MTESKTKPTPTIKRRKTIPLTPEIVARCEAIAAKHSYLGTVAPPASVAAAALLRGLDAMEADE